MMLIRRNFTLPLMFATSSLVILTTSSSMADAFAPTIAYAYTPPTTTATTARSRRQPVVTTTTTTTTKRQTHTICSASRRKAIHQGGSFLLGSFIGSTGSRLRSSADNANAATLNQDGLLADLPMVRLRLPKAALGRGKQFCEFWGAFRTFLPIFLF